MKTCKYTCTTHTHFTYAHTDREGQTGTYTCTPRTNARRERTRYIQNGRNAHKSTQTGMAAKAHMHKTPAHTPQRKACKPMDKHPSMDPELDTLT